MFGGSTVQLRAHLGGSLRGTPISITKTSPNDLLWSQLEYAKTSLCLHPFLAGHSAMNAPIRCLGIHASIDCQIRSHDNSPSKMIIFVFVAGGLRSGRPASYTNAASPHLSGFSHMCSRVRMSRWRRGFPWASREQGRAHVYEYRAPTDQFVKPSLLNRRSSCDADKFGKGSVYRAGKSFRWRMRGNGCVDRCRTSPVVRRRQNVRRASVSG
jgi:hypothetical protein